MSNNRIEELSEKIWKLKDEIWELQKEKLKLERESSTKFGTPKVLLKGKANWGSSKSMI